MSDSEDIQTVVYYDEDYPSRWINDSAEIAKYLRSKGTEIKNAGELKDFMTKSINNGNGCKKLIVFSQDAIPDCIAEDYTSTTTLREYLDQGGSILWMGDIPGWQIGKNVKKSDEAAGQNGAQNGAPVSMFGIVPIFAHTVKRGVDINYQGQILGLKHKWSGIRPILPDIGIEVFAESEVIYALPYITNIRPKDIVDRLKKPSKTGVDIEAGIPQIFKIGHRTEDRGVEAEVDLQFIHNVFPNSWLKNYNNDYPVSGFYRIWDFLPRNRMAWMREELYEVIKSIEGRLKRGFK